MWHKMWQESQPGNGSSRAGTPLPRRQASLLADPPAVKELVRAEVKMLLQTLRERASGEGRAADELLFGYKAETVDYALSHLDSCYRNAADAESESRPSSRCSVRSTAGDEIWTMRDKLNVSGIDQVVGRLRSFLMEECEALTRLVKHFKGNIKQRWQSPCEVDKLEPSLAELRELRGAVQMDLELYASPLAASPTPSLPLKELKSRFRVSAGQSVSDETLRPLSRTSGFRPHPPPPLSCPTPRPPPGAPPGQASASDKAMNRPSLSRMYVQHRSISASAGPRKTQAPICNTMPTSVHANRHFTASLPGPDVDNVIVETVHRGMLSPEQDSAALNCRTTTSPSLQAKAQRNSPIPEGPLSSHRSIHGSSREGHLGRKSSSFWRSRTINAGPSSPRCDAGSYTTGTRNGKQNGTCGSSSVSTTVQTDVAHQQSLVATCTRPAPVTINGQFFTSPKRPLESITSQGKGVQETELEFKFYQPVPPPRVST